MISGMRLVRQVLLTAVTPRISPGTLRLIHRHPIPFHSSLRSGVCSRGFGLLQRRDLPQIPEDWESGEYDIHSQSTIYALSTAPGKSAIAVVRISGPACIDIFKSLCQSTAIPKPRIATLRTLYRPQTYPPQAEQEILDPGALALYFPGPNSVTGEDVLELHIHGGPAIIRAVLASIPLSQTSHRITYAEPGEFTRRAFSNDRLTLPQIEALSDILSSTTEQQRILSVRSSSSSLSERYETWRTALISARGELEALIDFSEDQQFETGSNELLRNVVDAVVKLRGVLRDHVANAVKGELLRNGISLTLVGAPNAGKSSLLNRIVGREAVIVSGEAGTTRDVVDLSVDLGGFMVVLGDTAGLRVGDVSEGVGEVEKEGIRRAKKRVMEGDVVVVVLSVELIDGRPELKISPEVVNVVKEAEGKEVIVVVNKMDMVRREAEGVLPEKIVDIITSRLPELPPNRIFGISCAARLTDGVRDSPDSHPATDGIQDFLNGLISIFKEITSPTSSSSPSWHESIGATERQRLLVEECISSLGSFLALTNTDTEEDFDVVVAAEELRFAAESLAKITGRGEGAGDVEEVLGVVFEKFCVGK